VAGWLEYSGQRGQRRWGGPYSDTLEMAMLMVKRKENVIRVTFSRTDSLVNERPPRTNSREHPTVAEPAWRAVSSHG
jgi:hypothetical protein